MTLQVIPVPGMDEVEPGDDPAGLIAAALSSASLHLEDGDVVVVTHKVVSKAEGAIVRVDDDEAHRALVEREAAGIIRRRGSLIIAETPHGFICANAGIDRSNVRPGWVVLLPSDPDRSAHRIRARLRHLTGRAVGVVITDTFGRPWRRGLVDVAIGVAGIPALVDHRGTPDTFGRVLEATEVAVVDEIAAAADLVMGKTRRVPAAVVRGLDLPVGEGTAADLVRPPEEDLFR